MTDTLRKLLLVVVSLAVSLVLAEGLLRLVGWGSVTPELAFGVNTRQALQRGAFLPDDRLFWKLPAVDDPDVNAIHPDLPVPPPRAPHRLIVLGDSCSRISLEGPPYSTLLQRRLAGAGWEVLNAAVPGYTTYQGLVWLRDQLLDAEPDVVVIYLGWNDHWRATGRTDRDYAATRQRDHLRLLTLVRGLPDEPPPRVPLPQFTENLQAMVDACRARGVRVVLVTAPAAIDADAAARLLRNRYIVAGEDPMAVHARYVAAVRAFAGDADVWVLDAARLFGDLTGPPPLLLDDGIHLTDAGQRVMAAALAALIRDGTGADGGVPPDLVAAGEAARLPSP